MAPEGKAQGESQDIFHRLVRTVSGRSETFPSSPVELHQVESSTPSISTLKKKFGFGDFVKGIGKDLAKLTQGSTKSQETPQILRPSNETSNSTIADSGRASSSHEAPVAVGGHAKLLSMVAEEPLDQQPDEIATEAPPEPTFLARKIQELIDALPLPANGPTRPTPISKPPKPPARDADGRPIPPPGATPIKDSRLISFLQSATIMNGKEGARASIWSILEGLGTPPHSLPDSDNTNDNPQNEDEEISHDDGQDDDTFSDNSSVMMYSPLIPTKADHVELAELVPITVEGGEQGDGSQMIPQTAWMTMWPLSSWFGISQGQPATLQPPPPTQPSVPSSPRLSGSSLQAKGRSSLDSTRRLRTQSSKAWVPSETKLSVQVMWWGYRLYLPPPVLAILSDKTLEATKRAALITTALTWFFNNIPVNALPVAIRPTVLLLQRLSPYLGYIGTFISWSWSTIKGYDVGYGVILTATWILPVALIPGTWNENQFPKSPSSSPQSLPPNTLPPGSPAPLPPAALSSPMSPPTSLPQQPTPSPPATPTSPIVPAPSSPIISSVPSQASSSRNLSPFSTTSSPISVSVRTPYPMPNSPQAISSSAVLTPRKAVIPVAPTPQDLPPVPPIVHPGSPLMDELLQSRRVPTVPLPDEDEGGPVKVKKKVKDRAKALFVRSPKGAS